MFSSFQLVSTVYPKPFIKRMFVSQNLNYTAGLKSHRKDGIPQKRVCFSEFDGRFALLLNIPNVTFLMLPAF